MALGVARDADVAHPVLFRLHRFEQRHRVLKIARRLARVACDDEDVAGSHLVHGRQDLAEVRAVAHEPGREMRHDGIPLAGEPRRELQGGPQAAPGRGGDGDGDFGRHVCQDQRLGVLAGKDLVARRAKKFDQRRPQPLMPHGQFQHAII